MKPVYLISGDDESSIFDTARKRVNALVGGQQNDYLLEIYKETEEKSPDRVLIDLLISLQTPAFLGDAKTVWLQNIPFPNSTIGTKEAELADIIEHRFPEDAKLVISGPGIDSKTQIYKACKARGEAVLLKKPDLRRRSWRQDVNHIIRGHLADRKMTLSHQSVNYIVETVGVDTGRVVNELEKLYCYAGEKPSFEQVQLLCTGNREAVFYALGNGFGERNVNQVFTSISQLLDNAKDPDSLVIGQIRYLSRFFYELLNAKVLMSQFKVRSGALLAKKLKGISADTQKQFGGNILFTKPDWQQRLICGQAEKYPGHELVRAISLFSKADRDLVSSSLPRRLILENLSLQILYGKP